MLTVFLDHNEAMNQMKPSIELADKALRDTGIEFGDEEEAIEFGKKKTAYVETTQMIKEARTLAGNEYLQLPDLCTILKDKLDALLTHYRDKPVPATEVAEARKEVGGGLVLRGRCLGEDGNLAALNAVRAEGGRTDDASRTRVNPRNGTRGGGRNGSDRLTAGTVFDDAAGDARFGEGGRDGFLALLCCTKHDQLKDRATGAVVRERCEARSGCGPGLSRRGGLEPTNPLPPTQR